MSLTLAVGEELYDGLTTKQGRLVPVFFAVCGFKNETL